MEFIIIGFIALIAMMVLKYIFDYNRKEMEHFAENQELDEIARKYPNNQEMCQEYLKKLGNEKVEIEENEGTEASLYIALTNKILIGNIQKSYTRIQTIAHECLHSVQSRKILLFNFFFSNLYLVYFITIGILLIGKWLPYKMMFLVIFLVLSMIYYVVRIYLENDAMIKAKYLAKEYMEEKKISSPLQIDKMVEGFDTMNEVGIKCVNYHFFMQIMMKLFVLATLCLLL
ncbi:MAG: hypothetical protein HFJ33_00520 [Clostridia bacterium]|nr:hypothetical protein [Clostridia bacterium]